FRPLRSHDERLRARGTTPDARLPSRSPHPRSASSRARAKRSLNAHEASFPGAPIVAYASTDSTDFRTTVERWITECSDVLVLIRYAGQAGSKDFVFLHS